MASTHPCNARISGDKTTRLLTDINRPCRQERRARGPLLHRSNGQPALRGEEQRYLSRHPRQHWRMADGGDGCGVKGAPAGVAWRGAAGIEQAVFASAPERVRTGRRSAERSSLPVRRANAAAVSYPVRAPVKTETSGRGLAPAKASWTSLRPRYGPIEPACLRMSKKRMTRCRQRQPKSRSKTNPALPASASPSPTASPALAPSTPLPVIADLPMQRRHETASSCHGNLRPANYSYAHVPFDRTRKL
jgi:hypothetical protein